MSKLQGEINPLELISSLDSAYLTRRLALKNITKGAAGICVVQIEVAGEGFAVEVGVAVEIIPYKTPEALPRSFPWALGMIELRGEVVPIIDLSILNDSNPIIIDKNSRLMIVRYGQQLFGLLVSKVSAVSYVPRIHEGVDNEFSELVWGNMSINKWVDIHGKKTHFFDLKNLANRSDFLTLTY